MQASTLTLVLKEQTVPLLVAFPGPKLHSFTAYGFSLFPPSLSENLKALYSKDDTNPS